LIPAVITPITHNTRIPNIILVESAGIFVFAGCCSGEGRSSTVGCANSELLSNLESSTDAPEEDGAGSMFAVGVAQINCYTLFTFGFSSF
jgi:hypothetical protein